MTSHAAHRWDLRSLLTLIGPLVGVEVASVAAGLGATYLSLAFLGAIGFKASWSDTRDLYLGVVGACGLVGLLYWRALTSQLQPLAVGSGVLLGVLCSVLAHPLMWFIALLINNLTADPSGFIGINWHFQLPTPLAEMVETMFFMFYGLFYVGWITSLVGGCVGAALAWVGAWWRKNA